MRITCFTVLVAMAWGGCSERPSVPTSPSSGEGAVSVEAAALSVAGVQDVTYGYVVQYRDPDDGTGQWVDLLTGQIDSDAGSGGAGLAIATCMANPNGRTNRVVMEIVSITYEDGNTANPDTFPPAQTVEFSCLENRDHRVPFEFAVVTGGDQGFSDITVNIDGDHCSAKIDCQPRLEINPETGERGLTIVTGFACTPDASAAGPLDFGLVFQGELCCFDDGNETCTDLTSDPADNPHVARVETYEGQEEVANKRFVNTTWRLSDAFLETIEDADHCTFKGVGWISEPEDNTTYPGAPYPVLEWCGELLGTYSENPDGTVTDCGGEVTAKYGYEPGSLCCDLDIENQTFFLARWREQSWDPTRQSGVPIGPAPELYLFQFDGTSNGFVTPPFLVYDDPNGQSVGALAGDFDNDGLADYVVRGSDGVIRAFSFGKHPSRCELVWTEFATSPSTTPLQGGGFIDGDDVLDFFYYNRSSRQLTIYTGNGDGTFTQLPSQTKAIPNPPSQSTGWSPDRSSYAYTADDLNGDGTADLAIALWDHSGSLPSEIYVLPGNGDGTFAPSFVHIAQNQHAIHSGDTIDFDGDGDIDVIWGSDDDGDPGRIWMAENQSEVQPGQWADAVEIADVCPTHESGGDGCTATVRRFDFDGDGCDDLVATGTIAGGPGAQYLGWTSFLDDPRRLVLWLNDCSGNFTEVWSYEDGAILSTWPITRLDK